MIALDFSHVNYFGNNDNACTASFCFKSFNAFAQARLKGEKVFGYPYTASLPHTRIRSLFYSRV